MNEVYRKTILPDQVGTLFENNANHFRRSRSGRTIIVASDPVGQNCPSNVGCSLKNADKRIKDSHIESVKTGCSKLAVNQYCFLTGPRPNNLKELLRYTKRDGFTLEEIAIGFDVVKKKSPNGGVAYTFCPASEFTVGKQLQCISEKYSVGLKAEVFSGLDIKAVWSYSSAFEKIIRGNKDLLLEKHSIFHEWLNTIDKHGLNHPLKWIQWVGQALRGNSDDKRVRLAAWWLDFSMIKAGSVAGNSGNQGKAQKRPRSDSCSTELPEKAARKERSTITNNRAIKATEGLNNDDKRNESLFEEETFCWRRYIKQQQTVDNGQDISGRETIKEQDRGGGRIGKKKSGTRIDTRKRRIHQKEIPDGGKQRKVSGLGGSEYSEIRTLTFNKDLPTSSNALSGGDRIALMAALRNKIGDKINSANSFCLNSTPYFLKKHRSTGSTPLIEMIAHVYDQSSGRYNPVSEVYEATHGFPFLEKMLGELSEYAKIKPEMARQYINFVDDDGDTALNCAASRGLYYYFDILVEAGADINKEKRTTSFHQALTKSVSEYGENNYFCLRELIGSIEKTLGNDYLKGVINKPSEIKKGDIVIRQTVLHYALSRMFSDHLEIVDLLLKYGANPDVVDQGGRSALDYAMGLSYSKERAGIIKVVIGRASDDNIMALSGKILSGLLSGVNEADMECLCDELGSRSGCSNGTGRFE
ncbi:ankyrin repeat domain-containing protein [Endozoicomonas sp.]|uniref:ankyrin repeat domain-containing protein n=1 Tax=Endozoicomonas sp. TaxID=1892382 RepID=UPI00383AE3F9